MVRRLAFGSLICVALTCTLAWSNSSETLAQRSKPALVCKRPVLAALKPMPEFSYPCNEQLQDWDDKILKLAARVEAIKSLMSELAGFSDAAWWTPDAVDLSICDFSKQVGPLTAAQRHDFLGGDYVFWLFGDDRMRLVLLPDPCYQTQYGGANAFFLYRKGGAVPHDHDEVVVTEVLDGYSSRADNSVSLDFAKLGAEDIVEISTGSGGLNPYLTNYYFAIDPRSKRAVPKNLFIGEHGPTNEITSVMLFESSGGPSEPLKVLRSHTLAPTFIIYIEDDKGRFHDNGRTLMRKVLRWNGKSYR